MKIKGYTHSTYNLLIFIICVQCTHFYIKNTYMSLLPHLGILYYALPDLYTPYFMSNFLDSNNIVK